MEKYSGMPVQKVLPGFSDEYLDVIPTTPEQEEVKKVLEDNNDYKYLWEYARKAKDLSVAYIYKGHRVSQVTVFPDGTWTHYYGDWRDTNNRKYVEKPGKGPEDLKKELAQFKKKQGNKFHEELQQRRMLVNKIRKLQRAGDSDVELRTLLEELRELDPMNAVFVEIDDLKKGK